LFCKFGIESDFFSVGKVKLDLTVKLGFFFENVTGVRSCYDEGKRTAETLTMDYHRGAGVEVSIYFINHLFILLILVSKILNLPGVHMLCHLS
jgi:hypothetical protein